ncbi:PKD domain-containing protein [Baekduia soli]|nr:PKD domain-containing protein [Baekduia soli]
MCAVAAIAATAPAAAQAAPGDLGVDDGPYALRGAGASASKPESKLWFNDGTWWASLGTTAAGHRIARLDRTTERWIDTGPTIDPRLDSRDDALWDAASGKLYVASHVLRDSGGGIPASSMFAGKLWRYSYDPASQAYTLDPGFPADVNAAQTETLVIDKDSTGRLWATWTQQGRVYVNHTDGDDAAWGTPYVLPGSGVLTSDDISSVIHFGGDRIGVLWSDQTDDTMNFAVHADGAGDGAASWSSTAIDTGSPTADDHINLKADGAGRVYAATKTSATINGQPLLLLLRRSVAGTWTSAVYGSRPVHTRPIVLLEEGAGTLDMVATCARTAGGDGQSGGDICTKHTSMDSPAFGPPADPGTAILRDLTSDTGDLNDASSTKQSLSSATGMVVLASITSRREYWHADVPVSAPPPAAPQPAFTATPGAGGDAQQVGFADTTAGAPSQWWWTFGDGTASAQRNPQHRYAAPGTYAATLSVADTSGQQRAVTETVTVRSAGAGAGAGGGGGGGGGGAGPAGGGAGTRAGTAAGQDAGGTGAPAITLGTQGATVPYGRPVTVRATVARAGAGTPLTLRATAYPFRAPFADLETDVPADATGTTRFTIPALRVTTRVLAVGAGALSAPLTLRSAARPVLTMLRRRGTRTVAVRGTVAPYTRDGIVDVQRRTASGRWVRVRRLAVQRHGRFAARVRAAAGRVLRLVARPRDGGAHVDGTGPAHRVTRRL